jgi:anthranilate phosphoribosyltransferase
MEANGGPGADRFAQLGGWPGTLARVFAGGTLSRAEAAAVLGQILAGDATPAQIGAFVAALRVRGETVEEMAGFVEAMLDAAERVDVGVEVLDTCGTGGDGSRSINVSTIAAFVVAGAGVPVCKHGGRAASSAAGSADVLEAVGVAIDLPPAGVAACIERAGIGFCFAPRYHPAMRHAAPVRRELGVPTVFNLLGPLANPARARLQVVGVADWGVAEKMARVLAANGTRRAMVVHGDDGLDELTTTTTSQVIDVAVVDGEIEVTHSVVCGEDLGLRRSRLGELIGGSPIDNAAVLRRVLAGESGPARDVVVLNAAAALVVAGRATDLAGGVALAAATIDSGSAETALERLIETSRAENDARR